MAKKTNYNTAHPTVAYALKLASGDILCCKAEKQLAQKFLKELSKQGTKRFPYIFDESRADRFFKFFEMCRNPDSEKGEYYKMLPHQQFDFGLAFGWVRQNGIRRYRTVYRQESRGGAKTTTSAIVAMYCLIADKIYPPNQPELAYTLPNVRIDLMAVDKEQAKELREPIEQIVSVSPKLSKRINVKKSYIKGIANGGNINILSKDNKNKLGGKPSVVMADELAAQTDISRLIEIEQGLGKKAQYQKFMMTTAGDNEVTNPAKREYDYSKRILSGKIVNDTYLGIIREVEDKDDIHDPEVWSKAAPMFRYRGKYAYSDTLFEKVKEEYDAAFITNNKELQRKFKIFRLDRWEERAVSSYLDAQELEMYDECGVTPDEFRRLVNGKSKIDGFDFSMRRDLTADGYVWLLEDGRIAIDAIGFMPLNALKSHEKTDRIPYGEYVKQGILYTTLGDYTNREEFAHVVCKNAVEYNSTIKEICYDPYKAIECASDFINGKYDNLGAGFFSEANVIEIKQSNISLHMPTTLLRDKIREKQIVHNGNPLLRWCLENCFEFRTKAGDLIRVGKEDDNSNRRIDLAAAVINALARIDSLKEDSWLDRLASMSEGFF